MYTIYFDGGGYRKLYCIVDATRPKVIIEKYPTVKELDSVIYELLALAEAIKYIKNNVEDKEIQIIGDCESVIEFSQMINGQAWLVPNNSFDKIKNYCHNLINDIQLYKKLHFMWMPRTFNVAGNVLGQIKHFDKIDKKYGVV